MQERLFHLSKHDYPDLDRDSYYLQMTLYRQLMSALHDHDFYEVNYVIEGSVTEEINGENIRVERGCMILMRPGDSHKFTGQVPRTNMLSLSISTSEMEPFFTAYHCNLCELRKPPLFYLTAVQQEDFKNEFSKIPLLDYAQRILHMRILLGQILHYYLSAESDAEESISSRTHFLVALAEFNHPEYVREGVPALLRLSNFSHAQLCRIMRRMLKTTPQQYVIDLRLNMAFQLVQNTNLSLESVAEQVGYSSLSHFITIFTHKYHMTPSALRKEL